MNQSHYLQKFVKLQEHKLQAKVHSLQPDQTPSELSIYIDSTKHYLHPRSYDAYYSNAQRHGGSHYFDFIPTVPR